VKHVTYGKGALVHVTSPFLDGYAVTLAGTNATNAPTLSFEDNSLKPGAPEVWNRLNSLIVHGTSAQHIAYGDVRIWLTAGTYEHGGSVMITNGINLSYGHLDFNSVNGGSYDIEGISQVANHSTFDDYGGRYHADALTIDGRMTVSGHSTVDFTVAPIQGTGVIEIETGSTVNVDRISTILLMKVDNTGTLNIASGYFMRFLGQIELAPGGVVDDRNAGAATKEFFNRSTGELSLVGSGIDSTVDKLDFRGNRGTNLTPYAQPDGHGGMLITTQHSAMSLPTSFVHA
jgi:hypothetical protein